MPVPNAPFHRRRRAAVAAAATALPLAVLAGQAAASADTPPSPSPGPVDVAVSPAPVNGPDVGRAGCDADATTGWLLVAHAPAADPAATLPEIIGLTATLRDAGTLTFPATGERRPNAVLLPAGPTDALTGGSATFAAAPPDGTTVSVDRVCAAPPSPTPTPAGTPAPTTPPAPNAAPPPPTPGAAGPPPAGRPAPGPGHAVAPRRAPAHVASPTAARRLPARRTAAERLLERDVLSLVRARGGRIPGVPLLGVPDVSRLVTRLLGRDLAGPTAVLAPLLAGDVQAAAPDGTVDPLTAATQGGDPGNGPVVHVQAVAVRDADVPSPVTPQPGLVGALTLAGLLAFPLSRLAVRLPRPARPTARVGRHRRVTVA